MVRTRNFLIQNNYADNWTVQEEMFLCRKLGDSTRTHQISDGNVFNNLIVTIAGQLRDQFQKKFTMLKIKKKVMCLRNQLQEFRIYIQLPRVRYNIKRNRVQVHENYWMRIGREILKSKLTFTITIF